MRNKSVEKGSNFFWSDPYLVEGYTSMLNDIKRGSSALSPLAFPDSRSEKKRAERVTMKTSLWIIGLLATFLQLTGLLCGSYGVLRESFANLAQLRGYGEGRYGEGSFGGTPTRVEEALITLGTKTRLLPSDKNLTLTDRKTNAAWAIAGVLLAFLETIIDFAVKIISP